MAIVAKGSDNIWESFQTARDGDIVKDGGRFEVQANKGVLRKGVLRSEFRTRVLGRNVFQIKLAYDFTIETDQTGDGEAVITQVWDGGSPTNSIRWDYNTNWLFYRLYKESSRQDFNIGKVYKGQKIRIGFVLDGKTDGSGSVQIFIDGDKVVDYEGRTLYGRLDSDPYVKFGIYDDDDLPRGMDDRVVVFDNIVIGDANTSLDELELGGIQTTDPKPVPEPEPEHEEPTEPETPKPPIEVEIDLSGINEAIENIESWVKILKQELDKIR